MSARRIGAGNAGGLNENFKHLRAASRLESGCTYHNAQPSPTHGDACSLDDPSRIVNVKTTVEEARRGGAGRDPCTARRHDHTRKWVP
ncbi:hypothetical protein AB1N83_010925 [Pleurotus pulmonarius]